MTQCVLFFRAAHMFTFTRKRANYAQYCSVEKTTGSTDKETAKRKPWGEKKRAKHFPSYFMWLFFHILFGWSLPVKPKQVVWCAPSSPCCLKGANAGTSDYGLTWGPSIKEVQHLVSYPCATFRGCAWPPAESRKASLKFYSGFGKTNS